MTSDVTGGVSGTRRGIDIRRGVDVRCGIDVRGGVSVRGVDVRGDVTDEAEVGGRISKMFVASVEGLSLGVVGWTVAFEESTLLRLNFYLLYEFSLQAL